MTEIAGPLIFVEKTEWVGYGELVEVGLPDGTRKRGQVRDSSDAMGVVQVFEGTGGIDRESTGKFLGETIKLNVSRDMLGRILSGAGEPIDGGPPIVPEKRVEITGSAINPYSREHPAEFIQTGISTIDGLNTLVRGQKLPLFSGAGLPHNEVALQIARRAKVPGSPEPFGVVFAAMGITHEEARVFMTDFERTGALKRAVLFQNLTDGQIAVNRELHRKGIYPPIDPLPSLSRLMDAGIGKDRTREDHKQVSDQLYAAYAEGKDVRGLVAIVGKEALSDRDRKMLEFADRFEQEFIRQGPEEDRSIEETLEIGWRLLATVDEAWLTKIDRKTLEKYHPKYRGAAKVSA